MAKFRRRIFLIDKPFQIKYILLLFTVLLFQSLIVLVVLFVPQIFAMTSSASIEAKLAASRNFLFLHKTVWPGLLLSMSILSGLSIFITHKIAGPVYRIKKSIQEMIDGNLTVKITLRKNDELHDLAQQINYLSSEMRALFVALKESHLVQSEQLAELERLIAAGTISDTAGKDLLLKIRDNRSHTETLLHKYHL